MPLLADLTDESTAPQSPHNCTPPCPSEEEPGPSQVEGGRSVEGKVEGKESYSDDENERCMVEEGRSHRQDVDPGLWPDIVLVLVLNYKKQDSCKPLIRVM
ncbi:hypothetical protein DPX16_10019 [Anabarilius grahami]|uniref:Uncharacterized protein n=1 Tax=Anabarilius grahami TaxID=495550 RepID=A0A3N0XWT4_ANAGA|nr:hypothetical protein DPX16_10019 [Anabarilius grahami]